MVYKEGLEDDRNVVILVIVSQIWIQHLDCLQIIGHCHLRGGSELDPELGGALYTALVVALAEVERTHQYAISGIYGYRIPEAEGIGLFTVRDDYFRIFFLCEGLYGSGISYLGGKQVILSIEKLFAELRRLVPDVTCRTAHKIETGSFWFDLMCSVGFGGQIVTQEVERVYPLRLIRIKINQQNNEAKHISSLESIALGSLGYGWNGTTQLISAKTEGIFNQPGYSFQIYEVLFTQFKEFVPDFKPNTVILSYSDLVYNQIRLIAFLTLKDEELNIRYCLPVTSGSPFEDDHSTLSYLQSLFLDPL